MSEHVDEPGTEPVDPAEPDTEPVEPGDGDEYAEREEEAADAETGDGQQPGEEPEPESLAPRSEKEIEAVQKKLDKHRETNANRVSAILGEDAPFLVECPACGDEIPGFVWPPGAAPPSPDRVAALSVYIGLPDLTKLKPAPDAQRCPDCDGRGNVKTDSLVPLFTTKECSRCVGKGYVGTGTFVLPEQGATNGAQVETAPVTRPVETGLPPEAQRLVDQGYMVVPPLQAAT